MTAENIAPNPVVPAAPSRGFWRRRVVDPLAGVLRQGVTPDKLAATLAVGTACSLFPFLGTTTALNFAVGFRLRMNHPVLQTLNQLLGPVHLVMIFVYVRWGEWVWRAKVDPFTLGEMLRLFREEPFSVFLQRFGWVGVHAATGWLVSTPFLIAALYYALRPLMRRLASIKFSQRQP
jgi:uncharacterized protein (DUF2062 family)